MVIKTKKILIKEVTDILHDIGMPAHIKGFYYVRDAIILVYQDITRLNHIINDVCALVARRHHTSIQSVERNTVDGRKARPTNKEFIALIVDYLNIEHM